ncbi:MAG: hypothetical protein NZ847_07040 [Acidobacteria bacterium]|nr:hypothetical protein [Acidobacteriota bacterium]
MSSSTPVFATEHGRNPTRSNIPQGIEGATQRATERRGVKPGVVEDETMSAISATEHRLSNYNRREEPALPGAPRAASPPPVPSAAPPPEPSDEERMFPGFEGRTVSFLVYGVGFPFNMQPCSTPWTYEARPLSDALKSRRIDARGNLCITKAEAHVLTGFVGENVGRPGYGSDALYGFVAYLKAHERNVRADTVIRRRFRQEIIDTYLGQLPIVINPLYDRSVGNSMAQIGQLYCRMLSRAYPAPPGHGVDVEVLRDDGWKVQKWMNLTAYLYKAWLEMSTPNLQFQGPIFRKNVLYRRRFLVIHHGCWVPCPSTHRPTGTRTTQRNARGVEAATEEQLLNAIIH